HRLRQWEVVTGRLLREIAHDLPFHDAGFAPGTDQFIVAHGKRLDRWDLDNNRLEPIPLEKSERQAGLFRFSDDGKTLISTEKDQVSVWDWAQKKLRRRWSLDSPPNVQEAIEVVSLAVTKDGGKAVINAYHWRKEGGLERTS